MAPAGVASDRDCKATPETPHRRGTGRTAVHEPGEGPEGPACGHLTLDQPQDVVRAPVRGAVEAALGTFAGRACVRADGSGMGARISASRKPTRHHVTCLGRAGTPADTTQSATWSTRPRGPRAPQLSFRPRWPRAPPQGWRCSPLGPLCLPHTGTHSTLDAWTQPGRLVPWNPVPWPGPGPSRCSENGCRVDDLVR